MIGTLSPVTSDGKPIVLPNLFPGGVTLYYAGTGDDPTNGRGAGQRFVVNTSAQGEATVDASFNDWVYLAGGGIAWSGGDIDDWNSLFLVAPQTPVTAAPQNDGNCNVVSGVIVPAAGDGAYNVNLADAVPVPSYNEDSGNPVGYWDWDEPNEGKGTVSVSATPGAANWHLIAAEITLACFAAKLPILGSAHNEITVPAVKPKKMLPHWKLRTKTYNSSAKPLKVAWTLITARVKTV